MKLPLFLSLCLALGAVAIAADNQRPSSDDLTAVRAQANTWRAEHRVIDLHQHIDCTPEHLARAVKIMDAAGIGIAVNLSGGTVTRKEAQPSDFQRNKELADRLFPGRFLHYMNLDYKDWDEPGFAERASQQIEEGYRLGAAGFKEFKRLGLYLRDKAGKLIAIDDPEARSGLEKMRRTGNASLDPRRGSSRVLASLRSIRTNGGPSSKITKTGGSAIPSIYPPREELLAALNRVIERNPKTTFVCVHFANNAEDIDWVDKMLDLHPNMNADLAARIPEIGRHDADHVRRVVHQTSGPDFLRH